MFLAKDVCMPINFYLGLLEGEACHISEGRGVHQHIFEKSNMFNSFLSLQNLFSSNCIESVGIEDQLADIFTKPLDEKRFCKLRNELNILDFSNMC